MAGMSLARSPGHPSYATTASCSSSGTFRGDGTGSAPSPASTTAEPAGGSRAGSRSTRTTKTSGRGCGPGCTSRASPVRAGWATLACCWGGLPQRIPRRPPAPALARAGPGPGPGASAGVKADLSDRGRAARLPERPNVRMIRRRDVKANQRRERATGVVQGTEYHPTRLSAQTLRFRPMTHSTVGNQDFNLALAPMVSGMIGLADAYAAATGNRGLPDASSPGMHDLAKQPQFARAPGAQPVDNAQSLMRITTFAGFDHLRSYARLFQGDVTPVFSHLVLARAALQTFGPAAWLMEPGLTTEQRVKRVLLFDLEDALNRKRYGLDELKDSARDIVAHVRDLCQALGWSVVANDSTKSVDDEVLPTTAELIAAAIGPAAPATFDDPLLEKTPRLVWSYLSGVAHGFSYALLQSVTGNSETPVNPGLVSATLATDAVSVKTMAMAVASAAVTAGGRHLSYMGWTTQSWPEAVRSLQMWVTPIVGRLDAGAT